MAIEIDALCEDLRAWMRSPAMGLLEYSADPVVQRRVGGMLANLGAKSSSHVRLTAPAGPAFAQSQEDQAACSSARLTATPLFPAPRISGR